MKGRPRKPVEQARREGNPGHRPLPQAFVLGGRERPAEPPNLSPLQLEAWTTIVDDLEGGGVLDKADAGLIEAAAVFWGRARQARASLARQAIEHETGIRELDPLLAYSARGYTKNPLLQVERDSWHEFRLVAENLGLSPGARARLGLGAPGQGRSTVEDRMGARELKVVEGGRA